MDGYLARADGTVDWLEDPAFALKRADGSPEDYGYADFFARVGTTLMGHETYRTVCGFDVPFPYVGKENIVFTRRKDRGPAEHVRFVHEDPAEWVRQAKADASAKGSIWLVGGGEINGLMLRAGLIDRMELHLFPIFLGSGIPLFGKTPIPETLLQGAVGRSYPNGILHLNWHSDSLE
jgi:dihydrofolate reductase